MMYIRCNQPNFCCLGYSFIDDQIVLCMPPVMHGQPNDNKLSPSLIIASGSNKFSLLLLL